MAASKSLDNDWAAFGLLEAAMVLICASIAQCFTIPFWLQMALGFVVGKALAVWVRRARRGRSARP